MTGEGKYFRYRLRKRVQFSKCDADLVEEYMASHIQVHRRVDQGAMKDTTPPPTHHPLD